VGVTCVRERTVPKLSEEPITFGRRTLRQTAQGMGAQRCRKAPLLLCLDYLSLSAPRRQPHHRQHHRSLRLRNHGFGLGTAGYLAANFEESARHAAEAVANRGTLVSEPRGGV